MSDQDVSESPAKMTRKQAAEYIGVTEGTLSVWACTKRHSIPHYKLGKKVVYLRADLDAWLQSRRVGGAVALA